MGADRGSARDPCRGFFGPDLGRSAHARLAKASPAFRTVSAMSKKMSQSHRNVITGVGRVALREDEHGMVELVTADGEVIALDLSLRVLGPVIMALFSVASALQDRRYAVAREHAVLALPVEDAGAASVSIGGAGHVVVSLRLEGDAIFRFSLGASVARKLGRALAAAAPPALN